MKNLAIIITGQVRTFFEKDSFEKMVQLSKPYYDIITVFCIVNATHPSEMDKLDGFFRRLEIDYQLDDFSQYAEELERKAIEKIEDERFKKLKSKYFESFRDAHRGLSNPEQYFLNHTKYQYYQLKKGIEILESYCQEKTHTFDVVFKCRFDSSYPEGFYPHLHEPSNQNDIEKISFNKHNQSIIEKSMEKYALHTKEDLLEFNQKNRVLLPRSHLSFDHHGLSMGGMVCYNYESLERLFGDEKEYENILYSFNDYYFFSNWVTFMKLKHLFDESYLKEGTNPDLQNHIFCPETQLILFCQNNHINIIMYPECFYEKGMTHR
jgi:hypothetical protein